LRAVKHFFRSFDFTGEVLGVLKQTPHPEALFLNIFLSNGRAIYLPVELFLSLPFAAFSKTGAYEKQANPLASG
jgi:hypothetical protein